MNRVKVAVVQAASVAFDADATLDKVDRLTREATEAGAKVVVFPEAFLSAYPKGLDFGARVGSRTPEGRDDFRRYFESSIEVPGPATERIAKIAAHFNTFIVIGVIERTAGTLYCTVLHFSPEGELLEKHRKLMPTGVERLVWGQGDGSTLPVIDTPYGKLGSVICWENYMPLLRTAMYDKGVTLYCTPTADDRDTWVPTLQHIALEGRCFVLSACQYTTRSDYPEDYTLDRDLAPDDILMRGGSCIVGPLGDVLAGPVFNEEAVLIAELDLSDIPRSRLDFDVVGHYSRPDIFSLIVDESEKSSVQTIGHTKAHRENKPQKSPEESLDCGKP